MSNTKTITTLFGVVETSGNIRRLRKNAISKPRRQCVIMRIDEYALAQIDATAESWGITRGEAVARIIREVRELEWRMSALERNADALFARG